MAMDLVTVNLTRENEKEEWGFNLAGGGKDKDVKLYISQVRSCIFSIRGRKCKKTSS